MLAATPANSLTVLARLAISTMPMMIAVSSHAQSLADQVGQPLAVTTPSRALISWTMISASATSGIIQSKL